MTSADLGAAWLGQNGHLVGRFLKRTQRLEESFGPLLPVGQAACLGGQAFLVPRGVGWSVFGVGTALETGGRFGQDLS